jgi:hypothetical protein
MLEEKGKRRGWIGLPFHPQREDRPVLLGQNPLSRSSAQIALALSAVFGVREVARLAVWTNHCVQLPSLGLFGGSFFVPSGLITSRSNAIIQHPQIGARTLCGLWMHLEASAANCGGLSLVIFRCRSVV